MQYMLPCICIFHLFCIFLTHQSNYLDPELAKSILSTSLAPDQQSFRFRQQILDRNAQIIAAHNSQPEKSYELEINSFAALEESEIRNIYLSLIPSQPVSVQYANLISNQNTNTLLRSTRVVMSARTRSSPQPTIQSLQNQIFNLTQSYLLNKNFTEEQAAQVIKQSSSSSSSTKIQNQNNEQSRILQSINQNEDDNDVDWTCISGSVIEQGQCGACYVIAAGDSLSAAMAIYQYTFFIRTSYQEVLSCSKNGLTLGCRGGFLEGPFSYMVNQGILTQFDYPYNSRDDPQDKQCLNHEKTSKMRVYLQNFKYIDSKSCNDVKRTLKRQPIAIGIAGYPLIFYRKGVFNNCRATDKHDHAVLLIGFQKQKGWKIKNSWGKRWGENGYAWLADGNTCRICEMAFYPIPPRQRGQQSYVINYKKKTCSI